MAFFTLADAVLLAFSVLLAFLVRFEGQIPQRYYLNILGIMLFGWVITLPVFYFFRLYRFTWRYVSTQELVQLVKGTALSFLLLTGVFFVLRDLTIFSGFPRSALFITYFFVFVLTGGLRFAKRLWLQLSPLAKMGSKERILIAGAGDAGELILRNILNTKNPYQVIGFVDDSHARQGVSIHGVEVFGKIADIPRIVVKKNIEGLIVAMPSADSRAIQEAVQKAREAGLKKIKIIPPIEDVFAGKVTLAQLREVQMEDLLSRDVVLTDRRPIAEFLKNKVVLVTGAAGSIGSELCRQIALFVPSALIMLDQDETGIFNIAEELKDRFPDLKRVPRICDIGDEAKIESIFLEFRPAVLFHAAAYKHVPLMEENSDEAVKNNVFGTRVVAEAALRNGVDTFVYISTDKAVNPTSVMGATKRVGEMICQSLQGQGKTKFASVRFGNVLDSRGSVIPVFREKIKKREPIQVTHPEMKRYFMMTSEACLLVLQAGAMGKGGEVFVLDMGNPIKILELAKEMIKLSGLEPDRDIPIVFTEPRPGEKLFEEIMSAEEGTIATQNQKIFIAKLSEINGSQLEQGLENLKKEVYNGKKEEIIQVLKEVVHSYKPNAVFAD
ncbi:MAG: polysaccharide biosynthesis protein CapD [Parcubacteria group bacterium Gr01-1014_30]|nr:MAG: polysaccharide biosynthesis protein CapD [Parcubacteria group bacterium Gr01-1014_30]